MAFDRASVKGLPEGANVQVIKDVPYVYFRYQWKDAAGKVKYARDYLGTVENGQFIPNDYYLRILICVNGGLKHVNTPDSYLRERCAKRTASVLSVA